METNIKEMIENANLINAKKQANVDSMIQEINNVCDKIQTFVQDLRNNLLQQVVYTSNETIHSLHFVHVTL